MKSFIILDNKKMFTENIENVNIYSCSKNLSFNRILVSSVGSTIITSVVESDNGAINLCNMKMYLSFVLQFEKDSLKQRLTC